MEILIALLVLFGIVSGLIILCNYIVPWVFGSKDDEKNAFLGTKVKGLTVRQWRQLGFVSVLGLVGIAVHSMSSSYLFDSAALYVGLPFVLSLAMCLLPRAKSHVGGTFKVITIGILLSFPVLNEGVICVLMSAPIIYTVGLLSAWSQDRHEKKSKGSKIQLAAMTTILALASLEGVHEVTTFPRDNSVEYSRIIDAPIEAVREKLDATPRIEETRPFYMRLFPLPVHTEGSGLKVGDERKLNYVYKKWVWANEKHGSTIFRVRESTDDYIRFDIPYDKSYIATYLTWQSSEVFLMPVERGKTKVTWRLSYTRDLDPVWYFGPMQKHYVTQTAKALIDNVADPTL